jgi:UDP-3-O-[3-hydroxymyristoyl] glucosamine N-acyltransferase
LVGAASTPVRGFAPLDRAGDGDICFFDSRKYTPLFAASRAGVALVAPALADAAGPPVRIIVDKPRDALIDLIPKLYASPPRVPGIHPTAIIGRSAHVPPDALVGPYAMIEDGAQIGARATIGAHSVIGRDVVVGDDVTLFPAVTLYTGTRLGNRVIIQAGARIGSDGFGYTFRDNAHVKIRHVGRCLIDDDVEIGANATIDRGSIDDTVVGAGTKIDNLVHIAHNVRIGRLCLLMAQVGVAGSVRVEDGCILAGQVGVSDHHTIGARAVLGAQSGVFGNVPAGETWSGYPARSHAEVLRAQAALRRLPRLIRALERIVEREERAEASRRDDRTAQPTILEGDA